jgi:hypothetical protein
MNKHILFPSLLIATSVLAQQPPKWQAVEECNQAKELAMQIANLKNKGATRDNIAQVRSIASDGQGIMGDLAVAFLTCTTKEVIRTSLRRACGKDVCALTGIRIFL